MRPNMRPVGRDVSVVETQCGIEYQQRNGTGKHMQNSQASPCDRFILGWVILQPHAFVRIAPQQRNTVPMMAPIIIMGVKKPAGMRTVVPTVVSIQRISSVANRPPVETREKVRTERAHATHRQHTLCTESTRITVCIGGPEKPFQLSCQTQQHTNELRRDRRAKAAHKPCQRFIGDTHLRGRHHSAAAPRRPPCAAGRSRYCRR
jgi:hypothetical protein